MADTAVNRTGQRAGSSATTRTPFRPARAAGPRPVLRAAGISLLLLGILVLGFAGYLYGLSGLQEARAQTILYTQLQNELAGQVAPLGYKTPGRGITAPGAPVAILDIPSIGIRGMVVVEGTSPQNLMLGPGHRRDTPLPGQAGVSEIFGRRATFGAPFASLSQIQPGDMIQVATGQGWSTYVAVALATSRQVIEDPTPDRLLLLTATSPLVPGYYLTVDAHLITTPHAGPGVAPVISSPELPLAGDHGTLALTSVMEWGVALALVSAAATFAAMRWPPWACYLALAPVALLVLWNLYQSLAALPPNLY